MKKIIFLAIITTLFIGIESFAQSIRANVPYDKAFYGNWVDADGNFWSFNKNNTCDLSINGNSMSGRMTVSESNSNSIILKLTDLGDIPGYFEFSFLFSDDKNSSQSSLRFIYSGKVGNKSYINLTYKGSGYLNGDFEKASISKTENKISLSPVELKDKIKNINSLVKEYDKNKKKYTEKEITIPESDDWPFEKYLTIFKQSNDLKIIRLVEPGDDCGSWSELYYKDNKVFYILYGSKCFADVISTDTRRYYIEDNNLIQYLEGKKKKNIKPGTDDFENAESMVHDWIKEAQKYQK